MLVSPVSGDFVLASPMRSDYVLASPMRSDYVLASPMRSDYVRISGGSVCGLYPPHKIYMQRNSPGNAPVCY